MKNYVEEYERLKREIQLLQMLIKNNQEDMDKLLQIPEVKKFLRLYEDNLRYKKQLEQDEVDFKIADMRTCDHIFIKTHIFRNSRGIKETVYHCLKCGITNEREVLTGKRDTLMGEIFHETFQWSRILYDKCIPYDIALEVYNELISEHKYEHSQPPYDQFDEFKEEFEFHDKVLGNRL